MDLAADTYRVKVRRDKSPNRPCRSTKRSSCCINSCPKPRKVKKGSRCRHKGKNPSLDTLKHNLNANCCACCCVLAEYIKEACKLICSCLNEKPTETRICELFAQLMELTWCLGSDCCHLLRYVYRLLCVIRK